MLLNYLKLAFRLLARNPFSSLLNIAGLSIGVSVFFVLWQYSRHELASDRQWRDWDRMYRLGVIARWADDKVHWEQSAFGTCNPRILQLIKQRYPQVLETCEIYHQANFNLVYSEYIADHGSDLVFSSIKSPSEKIISQEKKVVYASPNILTFFDIPLVAGNQREALQQAGTVVISRDIARKYFGGQDATGQLLRMNDSITLQVTGVFEPLPQNTHLEFDIVIADQRIRHSVSRVEMAYPAFNCYVKLGGGISPIAFGRLVNEQLHAEIKKALYGDWAYRDGEIFLEPVSNASFTLYRQDLFQPKNIFFLQAMQWTAIVVLAMAWANYVILTLAAYHKRLKEIGVRRVIGARLRDLTRQFLTEAFVLNLISFLLSLTIIQLTRNPLSVLFSFYLPSPDGDLMLVAGIVFIAGVIATGLYPMLVMMSRKHLTSGKVMSSEKKSWDGLLLNFQFASALILFVGAFCISVQLKFIRTHDVGFDRNQLLIVDLPVGSTPALSSDIDFLKSSWMQLPGVEQVTFSNSVPGEGKERMIGFFRNDADAAIGVETNGGVDENFIPAFGVRMTHGRNFRPNDPSNALSVIISEGTAERLGFGNPEEALGQEIYFNVLSFEPTSSKVLVIGTFKDYQLRPLIKGGYQSHAGVPGLALTYRNLLDPQLVPKKVSVKLSVEKAHSILASLENRFKEIFPGTPFHGYFLDDMLDRRYQSEGIVGNQILLFTGLAVGIVCLGLLGLISNKIVEKAKEIGIRKVLGARLYQIAQLLLRTTARQLLISAAIGLPVAYYLVDQYLQKFSEHIALRWWHFVLPVAILATVMLATVATAVWKAAKRNPVEALKCE